MNWIHLLTFQNIMRYRESNSNPITLEEKLDGLIEALCADARDALSAEKGGGK